MKAALASLPILALCAAAILAQEKGATKLITSERPQAGTAEVQTYSSLDRPDARSNGELLPRGGLKFEEADLLDVLKLYQELSGRSVVRPNSLPAVRISFVNETPLGRREVLQALDTVLAANGITMVLQGARCVKAVPSAQAPSEAPPLIDLPADQLPESSSYMMCIVQVKNRRPIEVVQLLTPLARMPNSLIVSKESDILILRDYSSNIRRMLQVLQRLDKEE
jgi:general secretion pathway protein D